jgi:hypothetical protein
VQEHQCIDGNVQIGEIWKDIRGYKGRYQVSNFGRIKSLARMRGGKNGSEVPMPELIMSLTPKKDNGRTKPYVEVRLRDGSARTVRCKAFLVHRLVADTFIKPLEKGEQVDHINGKHSDNRVENLRIMHYVEHGRIHPLIANGELNRLGTLAALSPDSIAKMIATKALLKAKKEKTWLSQEP